MAATNLDGHSVNWARIMQRMQDYRYYLKRSYWFHRCYRSKRIIWPFEKAYRGSKHEWLGEQLGTICGSRWIKADEYLLWQLKKEAL